MSHSSSTKTFSAESSTNNPSITTPNISQLEQPLFNATSKPEAENPINVVDHDDHPHEPNLMHACPLCPKRFKTSQALGGHQNAHRRERFFQTQALMMDKLKDQIAENNNDIMKGKPKLLYNNNFPTHAPPPPHHHHHHCHVHHDRDDDHVVHSPQPLRTIFPPTQHPQGRVGPIHQAHYGLKFDQKPTIDHNPSRYPPTWVAPSPLHLPLPLSQPRPDHILANFNPYRRLFPDLVAQPPSPINLELGLQVQAEPFSSLGFGGHRCGHLGTSTVVNGNQNVGRLTMEEAKEWGRDLRLSL